MQRRGDDDGIIVVAPAAVPVLEEKKARKTATNTRAKMEAIELAGLCSNRVKEILACKRVPFSQASDYQSGKVADERGDKFCSQDALRMIRNQLDDDSSDDE